MNGLGFYLSMLRSFRSFSSPVLVFFFYFSLSVYAVQQFFHHSTLTLIITKRDGQQQASFKQTVRTFIFFCLFFCFCLAFFICCVTEMTENLFNELKTIQNG